MNEENGMDGGGHSSGIQGKGQHHADTSSSQMDPERPNLIPTQIPTGYSWNTS